MRKHGQTAHATIAAEAEAEAEAEAKGEEGKG
jgi:hypothetical protein